MVDKEGRNLTNWREDHPGCAEIEIKQLFAVGEAMLGGIVGNRQ
jgi:hypothetical protein